jgi:hypothetical protein
MADNWMVAVAPLLGERFLVDGSKGCREQSGYIVEQFPGQYPLALFRDCLELPAGLAKTVWNSVFVPAFLLFKEVVA